MPGMLADERDHAGLDLAPHTSCSREQLGGDSPASSDSREPSLQIYLKDIGRSPLLTARQEVELAQAIEQGDEDAGQRSFATESTSRSAADPRPVMSPTRRGR